ncbi:outer membrane beta-barrel protein [Aequorivita echinoideorum]|uniref:Outer membrane beta-barrel protein n=1 Tax=Aequorivita echinoideorum TaxID=1549647 RepID=A0ABS5S1V8_9FLAO|nr:outer membrane beta-barrel protein [Aequorivita echinoideorum]MBT0607192.1 outer membrane beta-barrel protein [Aequorivita echinoideorum]
MKNTLLILLILCGLTVSSQNQKGAMEISISVSPYPTTTNGEDDFGAIGLASFEYFISNKVSFSASFFSSNNTLISNNSKTTIHGYGFVPSIHYYFINKEKWNVHGQLGYGYGFEDRTLGNIQNSALSIVNVGPGAQYRISDKLYAKVFLPYFSAKNLTLNVESARGVAVFLGLTFKL